MDAKMMMTQRCIASLVIVVAADDRKRELTKPIE